MGPVRQDIQSFDEARLTLTALNQILRKISYGTATLSSGEATVTTSKVTASSVIVVSGNADGSGTEGHVRVSTRTAGTSFHIQSSEGTDNQTVGWVMFEP